MLEERKMSLEDLQVESCKPDPATRIEASPFELHQAQSTHHLFKQAILKW